MMSGAYNIPQIEMNDYNSDDVMCGSVYTQSMWWHAVGQE